MTTSNDEIKETEKAIIKKLEELQYKKIALREQLERLEKIRYKPRQVETPATEQQEVEIENPKDPDGPKIKTVIPATEARTVEIFDIIPKNGLTGGELTEETRTQVFDSVKQELTNF